MGQGDETPAGAAAVAASMFWYGQFLLVTGLVGYAMAGFTAKSRHGAIMGGAGDVVMCLLARMATADTKPIMMTGIHLGMLLPLLFAGIFGWQASKQGQTDRFALFVVMAAGSFSAFRRILAQKPTPKKNE